jgi:hypothetical protein
MFKFKTLPILVLILFFIVSPTLYSQIIKDDFRVNDDTTGGAHYYPDVELLESGDAIIVWQDGRNGTPNIYGQIYDNSGNLVDTNFKISTYYGDVGEYEPAISSYNDSLLVVWQWGRGQWLLSNGSQSGSAFNLYNGSIYSPDVAVSDSGFFILWDYNVSGSGWEIFLKRYDFDGDSIGPRMVVNDDGTGENQRYPSFAMDNEGNFVVVWEDERSGSSADIYGQLFDPSGDSIGSNFLINDDVGDYSQNRPSCAMDSAGNFIVVWYDYRDGGTNIYGQRFYASGDTAGGGNFLINDYTGSSQYYPYCAMDKNGNFIVVWQDLRDGNGNVYGQRFDNTGDSLGINFRIDQGPGAEYVDYPKVSMNENNFVVVWQDSRNSTSIYKRRYLNDGTPVGGEVKVNEFDGILNQEYPAVDMNTNGFAVITWHDYRIPSGVYFQRLNALGDTIGGNLRIDHGYYPDVAVSDDSSFAIAYYYANNIYYQRFSSSGGSIGPPAIISDTTYSSRYNQVVDFDSNNNAVVAWCDYRGGDADIYAVMVDSAGDTVGSNFRVNDDAGTTAQYSPAIARTPSGKFLIVWEDGRNGDYDIYGQLYDSEGSPAGTNFRIDSGGTPYQNKTDIGYHPYGNFIVVWEDSRFPNGVYAQVIDSTGVFVDTNFKVSDVYGYEPSVSVSTSGGFVVTWYDYRDGNYNIYAQKYNTDYSPDSTNYKVNNELEGMSTSQWNSNVATDGNNIIFTWQDAKWQRGWDIAAKVVDWSFTSIDEKEPIEISEMLLPNLPNPFINSTLIRYQTKIKQKISIKIYDLSGRLVTSLLDDLVEPGIHSQRWNGKDARGRDVPAGIYFCRMSAGNKFQSKKMVMLK